MVQHRATLSHTSCLRDTAWLSFGCVTRHCWKLLIAAFKTGIPTGMWLVTVPTPNTAIQSAPRQLHDHPLHYPDSTNSKTLRRRDRYYGATLDLCLAILVEIDNRNRSGQKIISSAEGRDDRDMMDGVSLSPKNSSPLALTPSINNDNSDVSPISTASASSLQITPTGFRQSSSTSPTSCTESSLSNSPTSSLTGLQKQCQLCGKRFTGTSRATNLKRHFRFAKIHNSAPNSPRFNCPYPGCGAVLNRSDNLKAHFQALHPRVASFQPKVPSRTLRRRGAKRGRDVECQFDFETIATELE